jgi:quinol monooxygenase YgiN
MERRMLLQSDMVRLTVSLTVSASEVQGMLAALRYLIGSTQLETGCLNCAAWADANSIVHYEEEWATEDDTRRHVRSPAFTSLLAVLELAREPPLVRFEFVTTTRGLDYVAEIRHENQAR